ncbi:hypothetical protein [Coleofasciculus sp. FACHB-1120]|uniref:hypothetical protein n=1 Tax=Coleofasciculus sp. FACHB-1120 TaxID=2692783 RepID=UPI00168805AD|nr:hypothetical protein [Coleofasciculus sp. FACHB-1120]MBD2742375.1 hypothetical protein [Coleofasciculus sp. FACHB-1120]
MDKKQELFLCWRSLKKLSRHYFHISSPDGVKGYIQFVLRTATLNRTFTLDSQALR